MLDGLKHIIEGLQGLNAEKELEQIIISNGGELVRLQKQQLLEGRGVDGEYIRPFYSEDPYFKKPESAKKYADWKQRITPNAMRPADVPNLFITGRMVHDNLLVKFSGDIFSLQADDSKGQEVLNDHPNAAGLDEEKRLEFATTITLPEFSKVMEEKTGIII